MTCCHFILSFHSAGGGTWVMAGCCGNVQDLLSSVNDLDKHTRIVYVGRPDALWQSSGCYICECRVPLLEGVRIGEARHVYSWGNPDEVNSDDNVCHASFRRCMPRVGRDPYNNVKRLCTSLIIGLVQLQNIHKNRNKNTMIIHLDFFTSKCRFFWNSN